MDWTGDILSLLLLVAGTGFAIKAKKRRFDRTNALGIERYATFWAKLTSRSGDLALIGIALCCLGFGTILLSANHLNTWGWVVIAPVCLFMLYLLLGL
jgi:hypothetical protein